MPGVSSMTWTPRENARILAYGDTAGGGVARVPQTRYDPRRMAKRRRVKKPIPHIYSPVVWPTWAFVGLAWIIAHLPVPWVFRLGRIVGILTHRLARSRRMVTEINLARCFPEKSDAERAAMCRDVFIEISTGALELMIPWLNPGKSLADRFRMEGKEHLDAAVAEGRGVVLVGAHYAVMDVISEPLGALGVIDVMYRFNRNPVWEWLQVNGRKRYFEGVIEREDTRQTLRRLKQGRVIWYAADQDYGRKHSVFAPFFGIEAATIVATSRFARLNDSPVLMMQQTRDWERCGWDITFSPVIDNFPSGDDQADAERLNALIEASIREHPTQYLWLHKRFKTRPEGEPPFYPKSASGHRYRNQK